jgi:hypothetical protein
MFFYYLFLLSCFFLFSLLLFRVLYYSLLLSIIVGQAHLFPMFGIQVTRELGVPAMKEAMDMMGLYGGPCRQPLQPLTDSDRQRVRDAFSKSGFLPKC